MSGTRNVQGRATAELRAVFLHVELSRTVRDDDSRRGDLTRVLAAVFAWEASR